MQQHKTETKRETGINPNIGLFPKIAQTLPREDFGLLGWWSGVGGLLLNYAIAKNFPTPVGVN